MNRTSRAIAVVAAVGLVLAAAATARTLRMVGGGGPQKDSGTAYFAVTHMKGSTEFAAGNLYDKVLGTGAVTYDLKVAPQANGSLKVTSKHVVLYTPKGSLSGTATATLTTVTTNGVTTQTISDGKLTLDKGAGSLKNADLSIKFTGSGSLATNQFKFEYKGLLFS